MEEMQDFKRQYEELAARVEKIDEVGVLELKRVFEELTSLDNRSGISIENYTNDSDNDLYDRLEALKVWDELKESIRVKEVEVLSQYRARKEVLDAKFSEYRRIKMYRRDNQRRINEFKFELDKHKALLNHISDSFAKDNMEDTIKDDEKHIAKAEDLNAKYDKELIELEKECRLLLDGGKLSDLGKVDEEDIVDELDRDTVKPMPEPVENPIKEERVEPVDPSLITPKKVSVKREEEPKKEKPVLPPKFVDLNEPEEEMAPVLPPKFDEPEEEKAPVLPPRFVEEEPEEEKAPVLPPKFVEEEPEEEYTDEDEEFTPVSAKVVTPKPSIWKKIGGVLVKAVAFLAVVGTAVHTGIIAGKTPQKVTIKVDKEETVEETENEVKEEKKETKKEEKKVEPAKEEKKEESKAETKKEEKPKEESKEEKPKEEKKEDKKEDKKEEKTEEETLDIKLNPGETVYNTDTGVEVGYNGNAAAQNSDGSVEKQKDRELEHNDSNQAIVTDKDLNRDKKEEAPAEIPNTRSGLEVPEEEFDKNLTEEEKAVADSQEEEWFRMLEESGLGR